MPTQLLKNIIYPEWELSVIDSLCVNRLQVRFFNQRTPYWSITVTGKMSKGGIQTLPMFIDAVPVIGVELGFMGHDTDVITLFFDDPDVKLRNDFFKKYDMAFFWDLSNSF